MVSPRLSETESLSFSSKMEKKPEAEDVCEPQQRTGKMCFSPLGDLMQSEPLNTLSLIRSINCNQDTEDISGAVSSHSASTVSSIKVLAVNV